ncbi:MAG: hypothetical protein ACKPKO_16855, partial [Candidatus Fonsibacter sp.]
MARLVHHSPQHQDTFRRHQVRHAASGRMPILNNSSYAEHRFDSVAKPLGRMVMHFDALLQTAVDIIRERNPASSEHRTVNLALEVLIVESMLQLGMVADVCKIVVGFIRFHDKSCFDILALPRHIQALKDFALDLFARGGRLQHCGYNQHMLALTRKPRLVLVTGG